MSDVRPGAMGLNLAGDSALGTFFAHPGQWHNWVLKVESQTATRSMF